MQTGVQRLRNVCVRSYSLQDSCRDQFCLLSARAHLLKATIPRAEVEALIYLLILLKSASTGHCMTVQIP